MSTQKMLEEAIELYGLSDIKTIKLSQKRDKEIVKQQLEIFNKYKVVGL